MTVQDKEESWAEPEKVPGKHRFMAGTCVDCGKPLSPICTPTLTVQEQRAYVEARCKDVNTRANGIYAGGWHVCLDRCDWESAYEWVVAREEEIRELGEEVEQMADHAHMALERVCDLIDDGDDGEALVAYVRDVCEYTRTWVRLSAILEEKKIGWKP